MRIQFSPKQAEAYKLVKDKDVNIILYGGAIRGGKTRWLIMSVLLYLIEYPNSRGVIIRRDFPTLKKNLYPSLADILLLGFNDFILKKNLSDYTFELSNGSVLTLMSESYDVDKDLNRFRGLEANIIAIDEINEVQEVTFEKCIERAGTWFKSIAPAKILATCNPTHNWVKTRFYDPYIKNELKPQWVYISSKITDNPFTPKEYLEGLKRNMNPILYQRFVDGDWDVKETTFFEVDKIKIIPANDFDRIKAGQSIFFFFDGAFTDNKKNDPSAIIACFALNGNLYINAVKADWVQSNELPNWVSDFAKGNGYDYQSMIFVEPFASGQTVVQTLKATTNLKVVPFKFPEISKIKYTQSKITRAFAITPYIAPGRVFLKQGTWNDKLKQELHYFPQEKHDDQVDVTVMAVAKLLIAKSDKSQYFA
jgi:predicted phage terminase large subunit-like protein